MTNVVMAICHNYYSMSGAMNYICSCAIMGRIKNHSTTSSSSSLPTNNDTAVGYWQKSCCCSPLFYQSMLYYNITFYCICCRWCICDLILLLMTWSNFVVDYNDNLIMCWIGCVSFYAILSTAAAADEIDNTFHSFFIISAVTTICGVLV